MVKNVFEGKDFQALESREQFDYVYEMFNSAICLFIRNAGFEKTVKFVGDVHKELCITEAEGREAAKKHTIN